MFREDRLALVQALALLLASRFAHLPPNWSLFVSTSSRSLLPAELAFISSPCCREMRGWSRKEHTANAPGSGPTYLGDDARKIESKQCCRNSLAHIQYTRAVPMMFAQSLINLARRMVWQIMQRDMLIWACGSCERITPVWETMRANIRTPGRESGIRSLTATDLLPGPESLFGAGWRRGASPLMFTRVSPGSRSSQPRLLAIIVYK